ncbi:unnamed protein product [Dracunculus medinensis]|uniref:Uncharacterized protein n=1 Tax=Dracunculus medinensis TaxID=318479 RepID=A0A0N4U766_DRAME|nr:unnamed protein product [Dracunculus medinensis]
MTLNTGYNNPYRISPDFGYYTACQKSISLYLSQLVAQETLTWDSSNENCPLYRLPNNYESYLACDFVRNRWYELFFSSAIQYELYYKKIYRKFWANYTSTFLIKPTYVVRKNGTETDWLSDLISLQIRLKDCNYAEYLISIDPFWPVPLSVTLRYRIRTTVHVHYVSILFNSTINRWKSSIFPIISSTFLHELCIQVCTF